MRRYPVYYHGVPCGEATVGQEGLYLRFFVRAAIGGKVIPRFYLKGERDEILLGVGEPTENGYFLQRNLSAGSIEKLGTLQGVLVRVQGENNGEWQSLRQEEIRLCREFCLHLPNVQSGFFRMREGKKEIAFPCGEKMPFPMPGLFCLARITEIYGREYAVFSFDQRGEPILTKK